MQMWYGDTHRQYWYCVFAILLGCLAMAGCVLPGIGEATPDPTIAPTENPPEATITQTQTFLPPVITTLENTPSEEPRLPEEPGLTPTQTPRPQPTATPTPFYTYAYQLQEGSPSYLPNIFHPELACEWFGIAGQIFDKDGLAVIGLIVEIDGEVDGQPVLHLGISGSAPQYGNGGYEVVMGNQPKASENTLSIVLFDTGGKQLTERIPFATSDLCTQNLVIMNFLATSFFESEFYLPMLHKAE